MENKFDEAVQYCPAHLKNMLIALDERIKSKTREICFRVQRPVVIACFDRVYFLTSNGKALSSITKDSYLVSQDEMTNMLNNFTEYSFQSCINEINSGYITLKGGHRAGLAGSCVYENGKIITINDISSVNLRIARQVKGIADDLCRNLFGNGLCSVLIAGAPASGKTTLLKDICRIISGGELGKYVKTAVIDERGEISASYNGVPQYNIGITTDVFNGYKKADGMNTALRSMSPQVIVLDEIANEEDSIGIKQSLNAGISVIATVHAGSVDELYRKKHICSLIKDGNFQKLVLLKGANEPGRAEQIINLKELTLC